MHSQDIRTIYVDSSWCEVDDIGTYRMDIPTTVEVPDDVVAYLDDITVTGGLPMVSTANNRLFVLERTPYDWDFVGSFNTSVGQFQVTRHTDTSHKEYTYKVDMAALGIVYFEPDLEGLHWAGLYYPTPSVSKTVAATYSYPTAKATWTAKMPTAVNLWTFGNTSAPGANNNSFRITPRLLQIPVGNYTASSMRGMLEYVLNENAFAGSMAEGNSGSQYIVAQDGTDITVSVAATSTNLDRFVLLPEAYLNKQQALAHWISLGGPGYAVRQTRSLNKVLGNMSDWDGTYYGVGDVNFGGFYTSPTFDASYKHLDGSWNVTTSTGSGTVDFVPDAQVGEYEVRSAGSVARQLQVAENGVITSTDYAWSAHVWSGHTVETNVLAPWSLNPVGGWSVNGITRLVRRESDGSFSVDPILADVNLIDPTSPNQTSDWTVFNTSGQPQRTTAVQRVSANTWTYVNATNQSRSASVGNLLVTVDSNGDRTVTFDVTVTKPDGSTFLGTWNSVTNRLDFSFEYWEPVGFDPAPVGEFEVVTLDETSTVEYTRGDTTVTGRLVRSTLTFPSETWTASWIALGRFAHASFLNGVPSYRWNSVEDELFGDRYNGTFESISTDIQIDRIVWDLNDGTQNIWTTQPPTATYSGSFSGSTITWSVGGEQPWTVDQLTETSRTQQLVKTGTRDPRENFYYTRLQDGVTMPGSYLGLGPTLHAGANIGIYDNGVITWTSGPPWTAVGVPPSPVMQALEFDQGQGHSCLYLHGGGMLTGLNSRGPAPYSTSCIAKIPIDTNSVVNHVVIGRTHRYVCVPPGSLSTISFMIRDASGTPIDMEAEGASISFVLTFAPRD